MDKVHFSTLFELKQEYGTIFPMQIGDRLFVCRLPTLKEIDTFIAVANSLDLTPYEQEIEIAKIMLIYGNEDEEALSELGSKIFSSILVNDNYKEYEKKLDKKFTYGYYKELKTTNYLNLTDEQIDRMTADDLIVYTKRLLKNKDTTEVEQQPREKKDPYYFNPPNVKIT